jgi:uncharacterized protein YkwD
MRLLPLVLLACATVPGPVAPAPAAPVAAPPMPPVVAARAPAAPRDDDLAFCVEEANRIRARAHLPPLQRSDELDAFAAAAARGDAHARRPHHHFSTATYPHPYSQMGENEIPWWPQARYGSVREVIHQGIEGMFAEGPGGGHHDNLTGPFAAVGCGIFVEKDEVTVAWDFWRP